VEYTLKRVYVCVCVCVISWCPCIRVECDCVCVYVCARGVCAGTNMHALREKNHTAHKTHTHTHIGALHACLSLHAGPSRPLSLSLPPSLPPSLYIVYFTRIHRHQQRKCSCLFSAVFKHVKGGSERKRGKRRRKGNMDARAHVRTRTRTCTCTHAHACTHIYTHARTSLSITYTRNGILSLIHTHLEGGVRALEHHGEGELA
jgi:hypothetical protein